MKFGFTLNKKIKKVMGLSNRNKPQEAPQEPLSGNELNKEEVEFLLKKLKTIDFKGFELDILISVANKLQKTWVDLDK